MTSGLSALKKRTAEGRRGEKQAETVRDTPKPSHPGRVKLEPRPEPPVDAEVIDLREQETAAEAAPAPAEAPKAARPPRRAPKASPAPEPQAGPAEKPPTVYLDQAHIDFAQDVSRAGTLLRPRVSISAAAVVRYALDQLREAMTPDKTYAAIADETAEGGTSEPGEKRPRLTAYVDADHRQYVDDVVYAARSARARGINASSVYRFAVDRLQGAMTAEQVCEAIASKPVDAKTTGRKRR